MLFTSAEFLLLFLPAAFFVYFGFVARGCWQGAKSWLMLASLFFYGWWNPAYVPLVLLSIAVNFGLGVRLSAQPAGSAPAWLWGGIAFNLGLLAYYKYAGFLAFNLNDLFAAGIAVPNIALPLAISFFSFTQIAYLVDCHRGAVRDNDPINYGLFVLFFPHLIAGPIVHHRDIMPQFAATRNMVRRYPNILAGLLLFSIGLFKKVVVADGFALWATTGFDHAVTLNFFEAWFATLSYTFQIYFDFSGYTDMAIGASLLFNIRLPVNFNSPYRALDIQDFWRRWHITLSRFLRDYLYVPLGGNRHGAPRTYLNLMITFLLGGLWHGASWMFVIWGALHGSAVMVHRLWQRGGIRLPRWLAWLLTFGFINITWVFFRAQNLNDAWKVLQGMIGLNGVMLPQRLAEALPALKVSGLQFGYWIERIGGTSYTLPWIAVTLAAVVLLPNSNRLCLEPGLTTRLAGLRGHIWAAALGLLATGSILVSWSSTHTEFIYFNF